MQVLYISTGVLLRMAHCLGAIDLRAFPLHQAGGERNGEDRDVYIWADLLAPSLEMKT